MTKLIQYILYQFGINWSTERVFSLIPCIIKTVYQVKNTRSECCILIRSICLYDSKYDELTFVVSNASDSISTFSSLYLMVLIYVIFDFSSMRRRTKWGVKSSGIDPWWDCSDLFTRCPTQTKCPANVPLLA